MPYRITVAPVTERKEELDAMLSHKPLRFKSDNPHKLRYLLNEALNAAKILEVEPYKDLSVKLSVRPPYVYAVPKFVSRLEVEIEEVSTLIDVLKQSIVFDEDHTAFDVVGRATKNTHHSELHFPNFTGSSSPVMKWAEANGYEVITEPILILRRHNNVREESTPSASS